MITNSTANESSNCCSSMITYPSGRQPRGNGSARISGRLFRITTDEVMQERCVKLNTKMPVTRNGM